MFDVCQTKLIAIYSALLLNYIALVEEEILCTGTVFIMGNSTINNNHEGVAYLVFAFLFIGLIIQAIAAISFVTTDTFCGVSTSDNSTETLSGRVNEML